MTFYMRIMNSVVYAAGNKFGQHTAAVSFRASLNGVLLCSSVARGQFCHLRVQFFSGTRSCWLRSVRHLM